VAQSASRAKPQGLEAIAGAAAASPLAGRRALLEALEADALSADELARSVTLSRRLGLVSALLAALSRRAAKGADARALLQIAGAAMEAEAHVDAARFYDLAAHAAPDSADAYAGLGAALFRNEAKAEARAAVEHALQLNPNHAAANRTLGALRMERADIDGAVACMNAAVAAAPADPSYRVSLGWALQAKRRYEDAFLILQSALELDPTHSPAYSSLADLFRAVRDFERALKYYKLAADHCPCAATITPYLFNLLSSDTHSDEEVFAEHRRLGGVFDSPAAARKRHRNDPDPERKLKAGFVSGDFYHHSVARFVTPILRHLDRARFEIYGIYNNTAQDAVTELLRGYCDHWFVSHGQSDHAVAEWIEAQGIDILIDLSGHTYRQRLAVFGLRPAPVQASYLGYPGTTGMSSMDYKITTANIDPSGIAERLHTEKLARLPGIAAPFEPMSDVPTGPLPHLDGAPFTFASMNQPWRVTPAVVVCWSRILAAAPEARLMLGNMNTPLVKQHICAMFAECDIGPERLVLTPRRKLPEFMKLHQDIDLALDTFPYNGGTTSTYSLWMGVPVVTLEGRRAASRSGACILREAGLDEFVVDNVDDYVARALDWMQRPSDLQALRSSLRERVRGGRPEEQAEHAAQFGEALRQMWRAWCVEAQG
jgi:protein O-GlcNAc transferase